MTDCRCGHPVEITPETTVYAWDYERGALNFDAPTYAHPGCLAPIVAELRRKHGMEAVRPKGTPRPCVATGRKPRAKRTRKAS